MDIILVKHQSPLYEKEEKKDMTLKDELPRLVGVQYVTGDQWRNNSRKNERMEPKQKQHPVVDGTCDRSKILSNNKTEQIWMTRKYPTWKIDYINKYI